MLDEGAPSVIYRTNETGLSTVTRESPAFGTLVRCRKWQVQVRLGGEEQSCGVGRGQTIGLN